MNKIKHYLFAVALVATGCLFATCDDDSKSSGILVNEISVAEATASGGALMEVIVKEAETLQLTTTLLPLDAAYKRALYESSDPGIFTVNQAGVITGETFGTATLHVFSADGGGAFTDYTVVVDYRAGIVNVKTPGTLSQLLNAFSGTELILAGTLNEEDMRTLSTAARDRGLTSINMAMVAVPNNTLKGYGADGVGLFEGATTLSTVTAPNTLTTVGDYCFQNSAVTTVRLPVSVTTVGQFAFHDCTNLTSLALDATTPPTVAADAFEGVNVTDLNLTVPGDAAETYRAAEVWKGMTINGIKPTMRVYTIPAATGVDAWVNVTLDSPLSSTESWVLQSVSTQPATIREVTYGSANWGVHLLRLEYTGTIDGGVIGNGYATEFYLGGESQTSTRIGAVGRGNWASGTHTLTPYAITLNKPLTISLYCLGDGVINCYIQNEGINDGAMLPFGTLNGTVSITTLRSDISTPTTVTITRM
jgi:hypothetical protein